jgi:hypothetical protein
VRLYLACAEPRHFEHGLHGDRVGVLEKACTYDRTQLALTRPNVLTSYHFWKKQNIDTAVTESEWELSMFADSGAFSAYSMGATIDVHEYGAWLAEWKHRYPFMSNLDVIRNPVASAENLAALETHGLEPLPVFHIGSPMDILDELADRYPYIALGGMVGVDTATSFKWAATCFKVAGNRTTFHGFGQTSTRIMEALPWRSVDSTSWMWGFKHGMVFVFNKGKLHTFHVGERIPSSTLRDALHRTGVDPGIMADRNKFSTALAARAGMTAWRLYEQHLNKTGHDSPNDLVP